MNHLLKENERELIKLINFFRKKAEKLIKEGKLSEEHQQVISACEGLVEKLYANAAVRSEIILQREKLSKIIQDHAECPQCHKNTHLKHAGVDTNEKGWKSNKYICKRCNISFVWNRPNNPWDMVSFLEEFALELDAKRLGEEDQAARDEVASMIEGMRSNIEKLKPVLEASDRDYHEMIGNQENMDKMIHEFKNHLLIEKIKMDSWEN